MRHIILAAIEKGLPAIKGEARALLLEHVLAQAVQAPVLPKVAPPTTGPMLSRPMAPKQQPAPQPQGINRRDVGMPMPEWTPQSEKHVRDSVKQMLAGFFDSNGMTDRSVSKEDISQFLGSVDTALSGMFQRLSVEDEAKLDKIHGDYDAEKRLRDELKQLRAPFYKRPSAKETDLQHGIDLETRGPNFAAAKEGIVKIQEMMLDLADEADKAGMIEKADAVAEVLPDLGIVKFAQFESANPYWLMNSRAFELAVKERKEKGKKPDDFEADTAEDGEGWHEAWWKTLEEYQDALMGEQADFLRKHASKNHTANKKADEFMLIKIADRMGEGKSPGVAFYEAMDDLVSGEYIFDVLARASAVADGIHGEASHAGNEVLAAKAKSVSAGIADWLGNWVGKMVSPIGKGLDAVGDQAGEFGYGLRRGFSGELMEQASRIRDLGENVWGLIRTLRQGNRYTAQQFSSDMAQILPVIDRFCALAVKAGARGLPKAGAILEWIKANGSIGEKHAEPLTKVWQNVWNLAEPQRAQMLQRNLDKKGKSVPQKKPGTMPKFNSSDEIQSVMKAIRSNLNLLTEEGDRRKAFRMLNMLRERLELRNRRGKWSTAAVKTAATREEISQWLMSQLGDNAYEFANAVGSQSALATPKSPTAPAEEEVIPDATPVDAPDDLALQPNGKKPNQTGPMAAPSSAAPVDDLELQPIPKKVVDHGPVAHHDHSGFPSKKDRTLWRLPEARPEPTPPAASAPAPAVVAPVAAPVGAPPVNHPMKAKRPNLGKGLVPKV